MRHRSKSRKAALGGLAVAATAMGSAAVGALAIGAFAIRRLAIGRVAMKSARFGSVHIEDLTVTRLRVVERVTAPAERPEDSPPATGA